MMAARKVAGTPLGELLGPAAGAQAAALITDLVLDSRDVRAGAAFVAVGGRRAHGLDYAADALARGAALVLYDPAEGATVFPERSVAVPGLGRRLGELAQRFYPTAAAAALAGVTGTNGKTTVAWLVAQAMTARGEPCGYTGTLGFGIPPDAAPHALTTPDCFTLHRELAALGAPRVAMEVSSHALAQDRIAGLTFGVAALTNLSRDHLDEHGDLERYGRAKARLFELAGLESAVLNVNDPFGARLAASLPRTVRALRVAAVPGHSGGPGAPPPSEGPGASRAVRAGFADVAADVRSHGLGGLELSVEAADGEARIRSPLIGLINAENLLVALGVLLAWRVPLGEACTCLSACTAPPGRLELLGGGAGAVPDRSAVPRVVVDYAHTPAGLERVLDTLRPAPPGALWCVFGCGGERDAGKRPLMGRAVAARADHIVLTDDNPRGEDPAAIVGDILRGIDAHPSVLVEHDRRAAIAHAIRLAEPDDVVLIAGKGHETVQQIGAERRPFNDREVVLGLFGEQA